MKKNKLSCMHFHVVWCIFTCILIQKWKIEQKLQNGVLCICLRTLMTFII